MEHKRTRRKKSKGSHRGGGGGSGGLRSLSHQGAHPSNSGGSGSNHVAGMTPGEPLVNHVGNHRSIEQWSHRDDQLLIDSMEHLLDGRRVAAEVRFSHGFSQQEVFDRWYALLYDQEVSSAACERLEEKREEISNVAAEIPWSSAEDKILRELLTTQENIWAPSFLSKLEELIANNPNAFHVSRSPKTLRKRILFLDRLESQKPIEEPRYPLEEVVQIELERNALKERRRINILEAEIQNEKKPDFTRKFLATLRGERKIFEMQSREILIGRKTESSTIPVDLDLSDEKHSHKISRNQAVIQLSDSVDFFLINLGRNPIYVNGEPVLLKTKRILPDRALIEIADNSFIFEINSPLLSKIRKSMKELL